MKENPNTHRIVANRVQFLIGLAALVLGSLIYIVDRPPHQTYFVYNSPIDISLFRVIPNLFGSIGSNLPSFIHVFSFILITASLLFCTKRGYFVICLSWFLVDFTFELGQRFYLCFLGRIPDWFTGIPFLEKTANYFLHGTFDPVDLAAITLGTLIAYFILLTTNKRREIS
jgi:hypothetical protein